MGLTDTILFTCPACAHKAEFPRAQEGKAIYCPKCGSAQVVRGTDRFEKIPTGQIHRAESESAQSSGGTFSANGRIDFKCASCGHAARIAASLSGQPVRCPKCSMVQLAGVGTVKVVRLDANGKLPFTCGACGYLARLNPEYAGKAIRCPKCQGAQVVPRLLQEGPEAPRVGTGQIRRGTGAIPRTPAGGVPAPLAMPATPRPGSLVTPPPLPPQAAHPTPPPGTLVNPAEAKVATGVAIDAMPPLIRTPLPMPEAGSIPTPPPMAYATPLPVPAAPSDKHESTEELFTPGASAEAAPKPAVVRRRGQSGRMEAAAAAAAAQAAQAAQADGAEPTVEPARAIDYVAPDQKEDAEAVSRPAWMVHAAIAAGVVILISLAVCAFLWRGAADEAARLGRELSESRLRIETLEGEIKQLQGQIIDADARSKLTESEKDRCKQEADRLRGEVEQLKKAAEAKPLTPPGP